jgi:hypothetical protein
VGLTVIYSLTDVRLPAFDFEPATCRFFARLYEMTVISPTLSFIVPILVWLLVCFRREDWQQVVEAIRNRKSGAPTENARAQR